MFNHCHDPWARHWLIQRENAANHYHPWHPPGGERLVLLPLVPRVLAGSSAQVSVAGALGCPMHKHCCFCKMRVGAPGGQCRCSSHLQPGER